MRTILRLSGSGIILSFLLLLLSGLNYSAIAQATKTVSGVVVNATTNDPVVGASVVVKGTRQGTTTGATGEFKLDVPASAKTLIISNVGFKAVEVPAGESLNVKL